MKCLGLLDVEVHVLLECLEVGGFDACLNEAFEAIKRGLKLTKERCPLCDQLVLDTCGQMLSFCPHCNHDWIIGKMSNPLADVVQVDQGLVNDFDVICARVGQCLVGNYSRHVEEELFDLLLFAEPGLYLQTSDGLGSSLSTVFDVDLEPGAKPVCHALRKYSRVKSEFIDEEVRKMLQLDVVEEYLGEWQSAIVVAPKPGPGQNLRFCVDLKDVNLISKSIKFPFPTTDEICQSLGGSGCYCKLDCAKGFWQVPVSLRSQPMLAFVTRRGTWKFTKMPFGHKNAPAVFQAMMNRILDSVLYLKCFVYIDDVIVFGKDESECIRNTKEVIDLIYQDNLKLGCTKCEFLLKSVEVLGHVVEEGKLLPKTTKVQGLTDLKRPENRTEVKSLYGLLSFFRKFVKGFSQKCKPITELMSVEDVVWTEKQEKCLKLLIDDICTGGLLLPRYDLPFIVTTDFSYAGVGGMVSQIVDGVEHPVMFVSRVLDKAEANYSPTEGEALAIVFTLRRCQHLLYGQKVVIKTDHRPLTFVSAGSESNRKLARWWSILQEFDYELQYVQGKSNVVADALSRLTVSDVKFGNETLECVVSLVSTVVSDREDCGFCDEDYDFCDKCGKQMCMACQAGTPARLPFLYCQECVPKLDKQDPAMNINLLKMLVQDDHRDVLADVGYDQYQKLLEASDQYLVVGDKLMKKFKNTMREIPSPRNRSELLTEIHTSGGHVGVVKLYNMVRMIYYWPHLMDDCVELVESCVDCSKMKYVPQQLPLKPTYKFGQPFQCWSIDLLPKLPVTEDGYRHILLCVDPFSKWCELVPLKTKNSEEVWNALYLNIFARFGVPQQLRCDRGKEFAGFVTLKCKLYGVQIVRISVQNPQANGQAERYVGVVKRSLKVVLSEYGLEADDWMSCLPACLIGLRFFQHSQLGVSPFMVCCGLQPKLPIRDQPVTVSQEYSYNEREVEQYVDEMIEYMRWICRQVVKKLQAADSRAKRQYDKGIEPVIEYIPGDMVLVKNRKPGVLEAKLVGPYEFVRYKDWDKYACVLKDENNKEFDCSVSHIVLVNQKRMKKLRVK